MSPKAITAHFSNGVVQFLLRSLDGKQITLMVVVNDYTGLYNTMTPETTLIIAQNKDEISILSQGVSEDGKHEVFVIHITLDEQLRSARGYLRSYSRFLSEEFESDEGPTDQDIVDAYAERLSADIASEDAADRLFDEMVWRD